MTSAIQKSPLAAEAHALSKLGDWDGAKRKLIQLISEITNTKVIDLKINRDQYSLNSLNGIVFLSEETDYFFKYHHEEGEEHSIEEYYRAELLKQYGFPVDVPVFACKEPGRQILLYSKRNEKRLADVCRTIEQEKDWDNISAVVKAQIDFDQFVFDKSIESYKPATVEKVNSEAIHQLFYRRLIDDLHAPGLGGRVDKFYVDKTFKLGDLTLDWDKFSAANWKINGVNFPSSIVELFKQSAMALNPENLASQGAVTAHGHAHNANVWFVEDAKTKLVMFDPAFAGEYIPVLLAEAKATFHNIYAHPYWLYEPEKVQQHYRVDVSFIEETNTICVNHDWELSPLRSAFLESKITHYWKPLIMFLSEKKTLPSNWKEVIRLALFCSPTLVMNLRMNKSGSHTTASSALGFAISVSLASSSSSGLSGWIDELLEG